MLPIVVSISFRSLSNIPNQNAPKMAFQQNMQDIHHLINKLQPTSIRGIQIPKFGDSTLTCMYFKTNYVGFFSLHGSRQPLHPTWEKTQFSLAIPTGELHIPTIGSPQTLLQYRYLPSNIFIIQSASTYKQPVSTIVGDSELQRSRCQGWYKIF